MNREQLEAVARLMELVPADNSDWSSGGIYVFGKEEYSDEYVFDPKNDDGDCLRMMAAMKIAVAWAEGTKSVLCYGFSDNAEHGECTPCLNDRAKALRFAACAVAVRIVEGDK